MELNPRDSDLPQAPAFGCGRQSRSLTPGPQGLSLEPPSMGLPLGEGVWLTMSWQRAPSPSMSASLGILAIAKPLLIQGMDWQEGSHGPLLMGMWVLVPLALREVPA